MERRVAWYGRCEHLRTLSTKGWFAMKRKSMLGIVGTSLLIIACGAAPGSEQGKDNSSENFDEAPVPMLPQPTLGEGPAIANVVGTDHVAQLSYHNGPVVGSTLNVYLIYYGSWSSGTRTNLVEDFVRNLGPSRWWAISTVYSAPN